MKKIKLSFKLFTGKKKSKLKVKKTKKPINKLKKNNDKRLFEIMNRRYIIITVLLCFFFTIILGKIFYLQIIKRDIYTEKLSFSTEKKIESTSAPRGRIYDRNYNLLVDNEAVKTIYYKKRKSKYIIYFFLFYFQ